MNNENVKKFYNDFVNYQTKSGINERIYTLYKKMKSLHLSSKSTILELGCGIGVMTFLLSKTVRKGYIEAVDLSDESINTAKSKTDKENIFFFTGDVVTYLPKNKNFDFITLFDVIEHIPIEKHDDLFKNIASIADDNTKILINIPNPKFIEFLIKNEPKTLQIIDQPIPLSTIVNNAENNNLELINFNNYSIWVENDYQFFVLKKKNEFHKKLLREERTLFQKIWYKIKSISVRAKYS